MATSDSPTKGRPKPKPAALKETVSYSELDCFRQCPHKWWLEYREQWTAAETSMPLARGSLWHEIMAQHYRKGEIDRRLLVNEHGEQTDVQALVEWMYTHYKEYYAEEDKEWKVLAVEQVVNHPLPVVGTLDTPRKLKGIIDLVVRDKWGQLLLVDHKKLSLNERVLTPHGWTKMRDINIGDQVIAADGRPTMVTGLSDITIDPCYRLTWEDGSSVVASGDHPWDVSRTNTRSVLRSMTSEDIYESYQQDIQSGRQRKYWKTPDLEPVELEPQNLPIPPYVLGLLIAGGSCIGRGDPVFSTTFPELVQAIYSEGVDVVLYPKNKTAQGFRLVGLGGFVDELGLRRTYADKQIPERYLLGSATQRWDLLRGLLDADESAGTSGRTSFQTTSPVLADQVQDIVRSLGGSSRVWTWNGKIGSKIHKQTYWVTVRLPHPRWGNPFTHAGKASQWQPMKNRIHRTVKHVERVPDQPVRCLETDHPRHLFVVGGYVLTHNTHAQMPKERKLELDDQMALYAWLLRSMGKPVVGVIYNVARAFRWTDPDRVAEFKRFTLHFSDEQLDNVAREARLTVRRTLDVVSRDEAERNTGDHCEWRCGFTEPCLASRKGVDLDQFLKLKGYTRIGR